MPHLKSTFANDLITWYLIIKRDLPWRKTNDPYKIWLSEIILQQTRVDQGLPYYLKFVDHYATVNDLALAQEDEVLRLWQGLGYYSRARNLHACAKQVVDEFGGSFPNSYKTLLTLPGIGPYTAAAIASISFGKSVPVVDGNVFRVLARVFGVQENIADPKNRIVFTELAKELMGESKPDQFNQAMMEFGALHCLPKQPACQNCIFQGGCYAYSANDQANLPVNLKEKRVRERFFHYMVFESDNELALKKRGNGDVWQGLYDFHLIEGENRLSEEEIVQKLGHHGIKNPTIVSQSPFYKHVLTHQHIFASFFRINLNDHNFVREFIRKHDLQFFSLQEVEQIPKPRLIQRFLTDEEFLPNLNKQ